ncbi:MAG: rod shape-determining protein MreD [Nitrospira sp.]|nr:rod shape-determining protein MreD [Nitrospira sp.]
MKKFFLYVLCAYAVLASQAIFFSGIKPDFLLILVFIYSVRHGRAGGVTYGAVAGLLADLAGGFIIGPNIISKALTALLFKSLRDNIYNWNIMLCSMTIAALCFVDIMLVTFCVEVFSQISFLGRSWHVSAVQIFYTSIAGLISCFIINNDRRYSDLG